MKRLFLEIVCVLLLSLCVAQPVASASDARMDIINKELDCFSEQIDAHGSLGWSDVCYTSERRSAQRVQLALSDSSASEFGSSIADVTHRDVADVSVAGDGEILVNRTYRVPTRERNLSSLLSRDNPLTKFEFGIEGYDYYYIEPEFPGGKVKLDGYKFGFFGAYTYRTSENEQVRSLEDIFSDNNKLNMMRVEAAYHYGEIDYQSASGLFDNITDQTFEIRGLLGYDIPVFNNSRITPFTGLGWRYLTNALDETGSGGYERESFYLYMPIGLETNSDFKDGWSVQFKAEYDLLLDGTQKSHFEDSDPRDNTIKNDQNHGRGARGSIRLTKSMEQVDFFLEPFFRYWKIKDSTWDPWFRSGTQIGQAREPLNWTREYGVKMGVQF